MIIRANYDLFSLITHSATLYHEPTEATFVIRLRLQQLLTNLASAGRQHRK
jgi:hypothetical protein